MCIHIVDTEYCHLLQYVQQNLDMHATKQFLLTYNKLTSPFYGPPCWTPMEQNGFANLADDGGDAKCQKEVDLNLYTLPQICELPGQHISNLTFKY